MRQEFPTFSNIRRQMERMKDESREEEEELKDKEVSEDHDDEDDDDDDDDDNEELNEEDDDVGEEDGAPQCQGVQLQAADPSTERLKKKSDAAASCPSRKCVPGIVYLGYIPPRIRPRHIRNLLASHGEIGRIFLQPEDHVVRRRKRKAGQGGKGFTEGWVEFRDKRVAKLVAISLNNTPIGAKRNSNFPGLWSIKYLHRFHWTHLSERLAYEQTVLQQRLRTEVSQAKRETNFYLSSVEKSHNMDKQKRKGQVQDKQWQFSQRQTEDEIQNKKKKRNQHPAVSQSSLQEKRHRHETKSQSNTSLLAKIFNSSQ